MVAFLGLGIAEIIILGVIGLVVVIAPVAVLVVVLGATRKSQASNANEVAQLRAEIVRLNDEIDRLKSGQKPSEHFAEPKK
jgi:hypothetical protein